MRAAVFRAEGVVEIAELPKPELQEPGDAIVRVRRAAICGSDLHFFHGKAPMDPGTIMGHEAVGVVEHVGAAVAAIGPGDRVVTSFHIACGSCWFCRSKRSGLCDDHRILGGGPFGGDLPGTQAQFVRVPNAEVNLLPVPDTVDDERALFVGDVLTTGVYAAALAAGDADDAIAILGAGPVGFCVAQALRASGAHRVFALDRDPARLALIATTGATPVDVTETSPEMVLARATAGRGADVVVDAVGAPEAWRSALEVVRRGGRVVVVGMYTSETVDLQLGVAWIRGLDLHFAGETPVHAWWAGAMDGLVRGALDPLPLVSHRLPLADVAAGYNAFDRREATKVVLDPWE
ncbi:MAG: alcohol dehydrogenase catalytic domain-containing protein [Actinomycetota bacterium]